MRRLSVVTVMVLLPCLGLAGVANAQVAQSLQVQGTVQSVDCQAGQVSLATSGGTDTFQATDQTAAYANGTAVPLCSLQSYVGDSATATVVPAGSALTLAQIAVTGPQTAAPTPSPSKSILSSPIAVGLGALLLGGIIGYVIGHRSAAQTPVYPWGYNASVPYPYFYGSAGFPANVPYNGWYDYQGYRYYYCTNGVWRRGQVCQGVVDPQRERGG